MLLARPLDFVYCSVFGDFRLFLLIVLSVWPRYSLVFATALISDDPTTRVREVDRPTTNTEINLNLSRVCLCVLKCSVPLHIALYPPDAGIICPSYRSSFRQASCRRLTQVHRKHPEGGRRGKNRFGDRRVAAKHHHRANASRVPHAVALTSWSSSHKSPAQSFGERNGSG